jgi:hypothetical protein
VGGGLVRAAVSGVPFVGGPVAELVNLVIEPAIHRRRDAWLTRVAQVVDDLAARGLDPARLAEDERFITAVLTATTAAMRTHEAEKLLALQNALRRSALGLSPDEHTEMMFLRFLDELTALHVRVLSCLSSPEFWSAAIGEGLPGLRDRHGVYAQLIRELRTRGLVPQELQEFPLAFNQNAHYTTPSGDAFLAYISDPPPGP